MKRDETLEGAVTGKDEDEASENHSEQNESFVENWKAMPEQATFEYTEISKAEHDELVAYCKSH